MTILSGKIWNLSKIPPKVREGRFNKLCGREKEEAIS